MSGAALLEVSGLTGGCLAGNVLRDVGLSIGPARRSAWSASPAGASP